MRTELSRYINQNMTVRLTGGKNSMCRVPPVLYDGTKLWC